MRHSLSGIGEVEVSLGLSFALLLYVIYKGISAVNAKWKEPNEEFNLNGLVNKLVNAMVLIVCPSDIDLEPWNLSAIML
jgi:hypothetical protein